MDHLRRGTLSLQSLNMVVLDEADEMLRMGFIEDVEWILSQAPDGVQKALFSATIPPEIRRIAQRYLSNAVTIEVEHKTLTVPTVAQRYLIVTEPQKVEALSHVLETELDPGEAALVFARTKLGTSELAEKLQARGVDAEAMNGDLNQAQRETVIRRLRSGDLEVVIATDVAARGLDVDRIGLVINYDIPYDTESYVHRIGRTGRAGRAGKAVLFVTPPQRRMLREIERFTGQRIEAIQMPSRADVAARRVALFKERLLKLIEEQDLDIYINLVEELADESGREMAEIAAAAARLARGDTPLEVAVEAMPQESAHTEQGMVRLFLDAGRESGVRPSDIVGAIANEAGVPGNVIGAIDIYPRFSFVDVPAEYLDQVLTQMNGTTIRSRNANLRIASAKEQARVGEKRAQPHDWKPRGWKPGADKRAKFKKRKRD
jgi:ATP-dependent RNA helicase DeaD